MRSVFYPSLVNGPFGDPALYVRIAHRGEALLFDCGDLSALSTREVLKIKAVFISHGHIDHLIGFDTLLRTFLYTDRHLLFFGPPGIAEQISSHLGGYTWNLTEGFLFSLEVIEWDGQVQRRLECHACRGFRPEEKAPFPNEQFLLIESNAYRVEAAVLEHGNIRSLAFSLTEPLHVAIHKDKLEALGYRPGAWLTRFKDKVRQPGTGAYRMEVPRHKAPPVIRSTQELVQEIAHTERGMKITYVTDASPTRANLRAIVTLAKDAHLLAIEATFLHHEIERACRRNHLTAQIAGTIARKAGAARMLLFHHSPRYKGQADRLSAEALRAFRKKKSSKRMKE